jgi:single-strand DNA-binding protein
VAKYTQKGSLVALEGRLQVSSYDNQEGKRVYHTEVVADNVRFLDSKKKEDNGDPFQQVGQPIDLDAEMDLPF